MEKQPTIKLDNGNQIIRSFDCAICKNPLSYEEDKANVGTHNSCIGKMSFNWKQKPQYK